MGILNKKSKLFWIVAGVIVVVVGVSVFFLSGHQNHQHAQDLGKSSQKKAQYICPMHPQITSDKPGTCPICGMDLVLNEEEEEDHSDHDHTMNDEWEAVGSNNAKDKSAAHLGSSGSQAIGHGKVKLSRNKKQLIGVKTSVVTQRSLYKTIRAPGTVAFDPELYSAQSEYQEALRQWGKVKSSPLEEVKRGAREMIQSAKIRLKVLGLSEAQIRRLRRDKKSSEGLLLGGKNQAQVYAEVFENELPYIDAGLEVKITSPALGAEIIKGVVTAVDNIINTQTRSARVRIKLYKPNIRLRPETFVTAEIKSPIGRHLSVPKEAVLNTGKQTIVFVQKEKGVFEPRAIQISTSSDEYVAIHHGLEEGDRVSVQGNFMLDSESRLKGVLSGMSSGGHNH